MEVDLGGELFCTHAGDIAVLQDFLRFRKAVFLGQQGDFHRDGQGLFYDFFTHGLTIARIPPVNLFFLLSPEIGI